MKYSKAFTQKEWNALFKRVDELEREILFLKACRSEDNLKFHKRPENLLEGFHYEPPKRKGIDIYLDGKLNMSYPNMTDMGDVVIKVEPREREFEDEAFYKIKLSASLCDVAQYCADVNRFYATGIEHAYTKDEITIGDKIEF